MILIAGYPEKDQRHSKSLCARWDDMVLNNGQTDPAKTHVTLEHKHDRPLVACRFDPAGRYVLSAAEDNLVHRFDLAAKTAISLTAHESWVGPLGCSPSGDQL